MSVVSSSRISTVSSVSSMLRDSGVRTQFIKQPEKIYTLPKDVKDILSNCKDIKKKEYNKLIYLFKNGTIKDNNLAEFVAKVMQCISLLNIEHKSFVQALLQVDWVNRSPEVIFSYKLFLQNLACVQTFHTDSVINHLVKLFKPAEDNAEHEIGKFKDKDIKRLNCIHDILREILKIVPISSEVLLDSLKSQFPSYLVHGTYVHEIYIYALLQIPSYAPQLRSDILVFIINRLTKIDVSIPHEEASNDEEDELMDDCISYNGTGDNDNLTKTNNDTDKRTIVHPTARILDSCMELFFKYMHESCFVNGVLQMENLNILYNDILCSCEDMLCTYASRYVQFIMFYICSFESEKIVEKFTKWLWNIVVNSKENPLRQTAIYYISSLCATASFISSRLVEITIYDFTQWINKYITKNISSRNDSEYFNDDAKHVLFYSVCQAFFHLFVARYKHFVFEPENEMSFLENLEISKIVTCKLNPLKMCDTEIVRAFAEITRTYALAYCDAVIEYNERNRLPIFGMETHLSVSVPNFFPFESYTLECSGRRITPLFRNNVAEIDRLKSTNFKKIHI